MSLDFDYLTRRLPPFSPKAIRYAAARQLMAGIGRRSRGIQIGWEHGFDSGVMLDHVYENRAQGRGLSGRLIDRAFLNAPGWVGIRNRGDLSRRLIVREAASAAGGKAEVVLADLACGGGRYVLAALADLHRTNVPVRATLRDYREENVEKARANTARLGVEAVVETADAFDERALATLGRPDIVIVSGLHEIIDHDDLVRSHFEKIHRILPTGGRLILTVQPDHPQVEFIARVLVSHTGRPWAMRLRSLDLTRDWLREAGFTIETLEMEPKGIFGVIVARKA